jgi:type IV secretory pathway VirB4 component
MAKKLQPAQDFVPIQEIRDGTVVLKDGSLRAVLMTSSVNFALKSEDEQVALLGQFQHFLNSLDFTVQIFIQSRRLDIRPYVALLEDLYKAQTTDLLQLQTREYIEFIKNFTNNSDIMTKGFFVVVPYSPAFLHNKTKGFGLGFLSGREKNKTEDSEQKHEEFEEMQSQLAQRVDVVEQGLVRTGIRAARLGTEELIELYYKLFNPGALDKPVQLR